MKGKSKVNKKIDINFLDVFSNKIMFYHFDVWQKNPKVTYLFYGGEKGFVELYC